MSKVTLFHDGCNICLSIDATLSKLFAGERHSFESVDLSKHGGRASEAQLLGVKPLPSLIIDGRVLRLDDHSPLDHYL